MAYYHVTGKIKGRNFYYPTPDFEFARKLFLANNLQSLWKVENGKRKLILKKGEGHEPRIEN